MKPNYLIGIDPGVKTGYAWSSNGVLQDVTSGVAVEIEQKVFLFSPGDVLVFIEDARKRKWFGKSGPERWKGAGSIMRDCKRWEEFCEHHDIPYRLIPPRCNTTKTDQDSFAKITKWEKRTNEHGRDAAMLIYGR